MNWLRISWIFIIILIIYLSLKPSGNKNLVEVNDKVGHLIAYFTLFLSSKFTFPKWSILVCGVTSFLLSCLLEGLQSLVPGREVSVYDLLANGSGVLLGVLFYFCFKNTISKVLIFLRLYSK